MSYLLAYRCILLYNYGLSSYPLPVFDAHIFDITLPRLSFSWDKTPDRECDFCGSSLQHPMILPASAQILLHSMILIWTAYSLITEPSLILESTIVVIIGHALQLVQVFSDVY